ncbi:alpha/beta fold hydrolase [Leptolyngbya sp. Cla-17]|uniref:alpha/beta fold hydrolase n=1 Tax=Leptolyngbya sp. Cla-17 TaxID=2803751 RepID=UPI001F5C9CDB|nr:hypothetical protein [Leptolyngbya sp. Cla-17]
MLCVAHSSIRDAWWKEAIASFTRSGGYSDLSDRIAQVTHPTLILWGKADDVLGTADATRCSERSQAVNSFGLRQRDMCPTSINPKSLQITCYPSCNILIAETIPTNKR